MAALSDLSIGFKKEAAYGTPVTVDRWLEHLPGETLNYVNNHSQTRTLRVGSSGIDQGGRRRFPTKEGAGDFSVPLSTKGMGALWELLLGTSVSNLVSGSTYQQNHTLISGSLVPSATIQKAVVAADGTVQPYTFAGCVSSGFEVSITPEASTLRTSWDIRSLATATAYTSPSYVAGANLFDWIDAAPAAGGTLTMPTTTALATGLTALTNVKSFTLSYSRELSNARWLMGAAGLKARQTAGYGTLTWTLETEVTDTVFRDLHLAGTATPITVTLTSPDALTAGYATLQFTLPQCWVESELPKQGGGEVPTVTYSGMATFNGTDAPLTVTHRTADTAL
jgi:hypothetical protein